MSSWKSQRTPKTQPDSGEEKKKAKSAKEMDLTPHSMGARVQRAVPYLSRRETDDEGKSPCRFFFDAGVVGKSCNRFTNTCARSHGANFCRKLDLTFESTSDAFNATNKRLVV